ncbi:cation:proton antiporter [Gordonia hongkongensis]|uniref:Cation:proton antiporter n=1 Tax=Gordonia hongkongensis TaxID=1701090 RepID=A0ABT6BZA5_9ACTN|nr:cation:proton antiporter [Gordonia hongkongensis]MDF6102877.1 cation:proton antiporter [Gordonia hongkongensis]
MYVDVVLTVVGALGVVVAAISSAMRRLPLSEPLLGLLAGVLLGPQLLDVLPIAPVTVDHGLFHELARVLLAVSVMAVALRYPTAAMRRHSRALVVLLLVAMPVMAAVSMGLGWAVAGLPLAAALLFGAAICPTDPVLASSVATGKLAQRDVPARDRQLLSLESGANDGLALPLVLAAVALAGPLGAATAIAEVVWQVLGALVIGVVLGVVAGKALRLGDRHGATAHGPVLLFTVILALGILGVAGLLHIDGVLAVFVGGLAFNSVGTGSERTSEVEIDESVNRFAVLPLFVLLGAALPWQQWSELGWRAPVLVLTILALRRIPIVLLLRRPLRLPLPDALYLGWFGPVGVSALFYLTLEAQRLGVDDAVLGAGTLVLAASTVAFGLSAAAGRRLYVLADRRAGGSHSADAHQDRG